VAGERSGQRFDDELRDLLVRGEAPGRGLREDERTVDGDLEATAAALDLVDGDPGEGLGEFGGQTGRLRGVVSLHAEFDRDVQLRSSR